VKILSATTFWKQLRQLLKNVPVDDILITKCGRPIAKLAPVGGSCADLIGSVPDFLYENEDALFSTGIQWNY
jgi:antitoxin (DNA-binding transcriptional repressor) of toxin-antitoxin stability system